MIRRAFLLAISAGLLLYAAGSAPCPDDYPPASFEAASEELMDWIDEHFTEVGIPFPPERNALTRLGLTRQSDGSYLRPGSLIRRGGRRYPWHRGLWKVEFPGDGIVVYHLLVKEPERLEAIRAFNTVNDAVGGLFGDYDDEAYEMRMLPEDPRIRIHGHFFTLNARIYGLHDDATDLNRTVEDFIFTRYDTLIDTYRQCRKRP